MDKEVREYVITGRMGWMAYRKWKETKQLPGTAGPGNMLGCCLISFHYLCDIHPIHPVLFENPTIVLQSKDLWPQHDKIRDMAECWKAKWKSEGIDSSYFINF